MAHFARIPTVGRRPLSTLALRNLLQVRGSCHAGNVKHPLYGTKSDVYSEEMIFPFSFVDRCMPTQTDQWPNSCLFGGERTLCAFL